MPFSWTNFLIKNIHFYPPYLGAGISLHSVNEDFTHFVVKMKLRWYNKNLFKIHFGGSLYAMCDPFFVFIILQNLGNEYFVIDKSAKISFKRPGKTDVTATFHISQERIAEIKQEIDEIGKKSYFFQTEVIDKEGNVVAEVEKEIYVRKK